MLIKTVDIPDWPLDPVELFSDIQGWEMLVLVLDTLGFGYISDVSVMWTGYTVTEAGAADKLIYPWPEVAHPTFQPMGGTDCMSMYLMANSPLKDADLRAGAYFPGIPVIGEGVKFEVSLPESEASAAVLRLYGLRRSPAASGGGGGYSPAPADLAQQREVNDILIRYFTKALINNGG